MQAQCPARGMQQVLTDQGRQQATGMLWNGGYRRVDACALQGCGHHCCKHVIRQRVLQAAPLPLHRCKHMRPLPQVREPLALCGVQKGALLSSHQE